MAVSEVKLLQAGAGGSADGSNAGGPPRISYTATYQAKCDDQEDSPATILNHFRRTSSLPWINRTYRFGNDFDTSTVCRSVRPELIEGSGGIFLVPCTFSDTEQPGSEQQPADPFRWTPEIEVSYGSFSAPVEHAILVKANNAAGLSKHLKIGTFMPVVNSSGQPLNPTFEEEYSFKIIRFTTNVAAHDDDAWNTYQDAINRSTFTINLPRLRFRTRVGKHRGKLRIVASLGFAGRIPYYRRTIELQIRDWNRAILDKGTVESFSVGDTLPDQSQVQQGDIPSGRTTVDLPAKDKDDMPLTEPFLLDGKGKWLSEGKPPVSLIWRTFHEEDFSRIRWI
jgi:hypothetical protein